MFASPVSRQPVPGNPVAGFPALLLLRALCDTQAGYYARTVHALMEAGEAAMEQHREASRMLLATATVAIRQWSAAGGAYGWMNPALQAKAVVEAELAAELATGFARELACELVPELVPGLAPELAPELAKSADKAACDSSH